ncbi:MAG: hypothetical protein Q9214_007370, partial [Letrouitia sp. 1 TL-2023]
PAPPDLRSLASDMCRIFEAIELWPGSYPGSLVAAQATLGIATLFLPKDEKHIMWCRQKLAAIESRGYTYPPTFRAKMAELWGLPEILHWWLPDDEGYPAIIRSIRSFIEERTLKSSEQAKTEDVRNMKAIFSKLTLDEGTKDDLKTNNN